MFWNIFVFFCFFNFPRATFRSFSRSPTENNVEGASKICSKSPARCFFSVFFVAAFSEISKIPFKTSTQESLLASWASQGRPKEHPRPPKTLPFSSFCSNASAVLRFRKKTKTLPPLLFFASNCVFFSQAASGRPPERPKRPQEAPKSAPGGSKRASRDPKSRSKGLKKPKSLKSLPRRPQDFPKPFDRQPFSEKWKNSNCKSSQESFKMSTKFFRSTWSGSRFRKNKQIQIIAPKSIEDT